MKEILGILRQELVLCMRLSELTEQQRTALVKTLDSQEAAAAVVKACEKLDAARTAYNEAAPLTPCAAAGSRNWSWGCTPWPWEG